MKRLLLASVLLAPIAAHAQCSGPAGVPFNCAAGINPQSTDLVLGGSINAQPGRTVQWQIGQLFSAILPSPPAIGNVTPAAGNFTTLGATGKITAPASSTTAASLLLPPGTAPTSPVNGDVWTTSSGMYAQIAGATVGPFGTAGGAAAAGTLTGTTLASNVVNSSLTSVGTLASLTMGGAITPTQTSGIIGTTTNNNANAGSVGEFQSASLASGSAVSLSNGTAANIASVSLTAGDWDCSGTGSFVASVGSSGYQIWTNSTSASVPSLPYSGLGYIALTSYYLTGATEYAGLQRYSLSGTTTVYLSALSYFASGTVTVYGTIRCRRVR